MLINKNNKKLNNWCGGKNILLFSIITLLVGAGIFVWPGQPKEAEASPPTVSTEIATVDIQNDQTTLKGNITDTGGENPSQRVLEWGTTSESYTNSYNCGSGGTGEFSHTISINSGTIYYHKAKAYNSGGWGYGIERQVVIYIASGGQQSFTTLPTNVPTIDINTPQDQWYNEDSPLLDIDFTDDVALDDGFYQIDSTNPGDWIPIFTNDPDTSYNTITDYPDFKIPDADWADLSEGEHTIYFKATDDEGNVAGDDGSKSLVINKDVTDPTVTVFDVAPILVNIANPDTTISWTVTDSGGSHISHVEVWRTVDLAGAPDDTQWQQIGPNYPAPVDSDSWSDSSTDSPSDGTYWYGVHVVDEAGNRQTETESGLSPIQVTVDKTPPPPPTCDPAGGSFINSIDVTATSTEPGVTIRYTTDGTSPTTASPEYPASLTFTETTILTVAGWDSAGNRSTDNSYTYTITIDTTPPTTTIKIIRTSTGEEVSGMWLNADTYTIQFVDEDLESGLQNCEYFINACDMGGGNCTTEIVSLTSRNCNSLVQITAGENEPVYNLGGEGRYYIYSGVTDNANNSEWNYRYLWFDFKAPTPHF